MQQARLYEHAVRAQLAGHRQMAFVAGPRQVGKTTTCRACGDCYLDWDNQDHRARILAGPAAVMELVDIDRPRAQVPVLVLDELHKYPRWKTFLKGLFDTYEGRCRLVVTGSSRLDVYRRGGDSLMGRYFLHRMHPLSVAELLTCEPPAEVLRPPMPLADGLWRTLLEHGGFPEPFTQASASFRRRWARLRRQQLLREDLRDLTRIQDLGQLEHLSTLLDRLSGERLVFANLAQELRVDDKTARRWVETFCAFHHGFLVRPWFRNVAKALRKEPKWFLRDWSGVEDPGQRAETLVANHLLKAVEGWTDLGLGDFALHFIRDKQQREVDFLIVRDGRPWILVEVKLGDRPLSPALALMQAQTGATHAVQLGLDDAPAGIDVRDHHQPVKLAARDFLSQLL
jgi:predicted AAA+ superfamily ATPase